MESPVLTFSCTVVRVRSGVSRFKRPSSSAPPQNQALPFGVPDTCGRPERLGKVAASPFGFSRIFIIDYLRKWSLGILKQIFLG